jgi:plastocyanin
LLLTSAGFALAADQSVAIANFAYSPSTVTVSVGDSVTWTNNDEAPHTATADDDSWDTGTLAQNGTGAVTFDTAGEYSYHCDIHPNMTGTVVVEAAAAGGGGGTPAPTNPQTDTLAGSPAGPSTVLIAGVLALLAVAVFAVTFLVDRRLDRR